MTRRNVAEFLGILTMAACTIVFLALWWTAYLTQNAIHMPINEYGEATLEAAIWFLITPLMLYAAYSYLTRFPRA